MHNLLGYGGFLYYVLSTLSCIDCVLYSSESYILIEYRHGLYCVLYSTRDDVVAGKSSALAGRHYCIRPVRIILCPVLFRYI